MDVLHISNLFNEERILKSDGKVESERASLIRYFVQKIDRPAKIIGIRLAHYTLDQLYALKSGHEDRVRRNDKISATKWFWYITKTTNE